VELCGSAPSIALEANATELDAAGDELVVHEDELFVDKDELAEVKVLELLPEEVAIVELLLSVVFVSVVLLRTTMEL
jgi:hypothetical protein